VAEMHSESFEATKPRSYEENNSKIYE
jgi:hypothetical protein